MSLTHPDQRGGVADGSFETSVLLIYDTLSGSFNEEKKKCQMITSILVFRLPGAPVPTELVADATSSRYEDVNNGAEAVDRHTASMMFDKTSRQAVRDAALDGVLAVPACPSVARTRVLVQSCISRGATQGLGTVLSDASDGEWDYREIDACSSATGIDLTVTRFASGCALGEPTCGANPPGVVFHLLPDLPDRRPARSADVTFGAPRAADLPFVAPSSHGPIPNTGALTAHFETLAVGLDEKGAERSATAATVLTVPVSAGDGLQEGVVVTIDITGYVHSANGATVALTIGKGEGWSTETFSDDTSTEFCWRLEVPLPASGEITLPILLTAFRNGDGGEALAKIESIDYAWRREPASDARSNGDVAHVGTPVA